MYLSVVIASQSPIDDFSFVFVQDEVFVPYANWLAENDRFDEAQEGKRDCDKSVAKVIQLLAVWERAGAVVIYIMGLFLGMHFDPVSCAAS